MPIDTRREVILPRSSIPIFRVLGYRHPFVEMSQTTNNVPFPLGTSPCYTLADVCAHKDNFWMIYGNGVYDFTAYYEKHKDDPQIVAALELYAGCNITAFINTKYPPALINTINQYLKNYYVGILCNYPGTSSCDCPP